MLRNALVPDEGSLYLGVRETVVYRSWRPTDPGGLWVLEEYKSRRSTGPGGLQVLEAYGSWRPTCLGGAPVLDGYRSWRPRDPGGVQVLEFYKSWSSDIREGLRVEPLLLHIERKVFWTCPTGRRPRGRPRTQWRDYISHLASERLGVPPEELKEVGGERAVWAPS
ncbi:hypothetical protein D4764_0217000 [Takifugu flavidus]|uniref:Uncharacterized protein n=1 Tax=Takifugu flavidus TaxID=433684 RepID=A0A5C6MN90_9TELE|nr:hypothetical protein D4764_0217000 [Takifugu flavidus]